MINNGDASEIKKDYLDTLENLLKLIQQKAESKGIRTNRQISIHANGKKVYKGVIGEYPSKNTLTPEQLENIRKAISDPQNSQGTITIKIGQQEVFRSQNGRVTNDKLGLAPQENEVETPEQIYSIEALEKQVKNLQSKLKAQQKVVDHIKSKEQEKTPKILSELATQVVELSKSLEQQQQLLEKAQKAFLQINKRSLLPIKNTKLQNWVSGVEKNLKQTAKNLFDGIKDFFIPENTKLRNEISQMQRQILQEIADLKKELNQQVNSVKTENKSLTEKPRNQKLEQNLKLLIRYFGKDNSDGSRSFQTRTLDFEQRGDNVTVRAKNGEIIFQDGVLSPHISQEQVQALDQTYFAVKKYHQLQVNVKQESQSVSRTPIH